MRRTLEVLNSLERDGLFRRYALGGAIAALFYMDPFETEDLDVFVTLPGDAHPLSPLAAVYEELRKRGYIEEGPYIEIEGVPVQLLPAYNPLIEEAVTEARVAEYDTTPTRVPTAEHLAAIMIQTGRAKDRARFEDLREQVSLDQDLLEEIVERHGLAEKYRSWTK